MKTRNEIRAERRWAWNDVALYLLQHTRETEASDERTAIGTNVTFAPLHPDVAWPEPTVRLRFDEAQQLMDSLWNCGLRPTEGSGSAGSLAATQKHLEDMRKLTFDLVGRKP